MFSNKSGKSRSKRKHRLNTLSKRQKRIHEKKRQESAKFFKKLGEENWDRWLMNPQKTP